jgi:hypothetical protein
VSGCRCVQTAGEHNAEVRPPVVSLKLTPNDLAELPQVQAAKARRLLQADDSPPQDGRATMVIKCSIAPCETVAGDLRLLEQLDDR